MNDPVDREELMERLAQMREYYRKLGMEEAEDAILDFMDFVVGYCSPHMKL